MNLDDLIGTVDTYVNGSWIESLDPLTIGTKVKFWYSYYNAFIAGKIAIFQNKRAILLDRKELGRYQPVREDQENYVTWNDGRLNNFYLEKRKLK